MMIKIHSKRRKKDDIQSKSNTKLRYTGISYINIIQRECENVRVVTTITGKTMQITANE